MSEKYSSRVLDAVAVWLPTLPSSPSTSRDATDVLDDLERRYCLHATIAAVRARQSTRIALQFPDSLLGEAPLVCAVLTALAKDARMEAGAESPEVRYFILGDTSYGECCVDEVAAEHLHGELVIHYGDCCLSRTRSLPVLYVPQARDISVQAILQRIKSIAAEGKSNELLLLWDVSFWKAMDKVRDATSQTPEGLKIEVARLKMDISQPIEPCKDGEDRVTIGERSPELIEIGPLQFRKGREPEDRPILWIGSSGSALRNAALRFRNCPFFVWSGVQEDATEASEYKRLLGRRYYLIEKARDAERIGIVAGTLGVSGNLAIIERCKRIIEDAGRKWYVLVVGKPTPSKLANFAEMDLFVLVACPQNSLIDSKEYFKPIITPLELDAALGNGDVFTKPYTADFTDLLKKFESGTLDTVEDGKDSKKVTVRPGMDVSVPGQGGAADFLQQREWKGLDYSGEEKRVPIDQLSTEVETGRSGIASNYKGEKG
eukprot:Plantae.Rhodophyta-Hildenbrandia_rubra.ctg2993.p1 GENE.Plantae.Rhodophyta-Hildenbrandia_rubra.ctg2993~~Plantae.Rhodophyta-Hildenbrandia_rubra.ctg2993.p1  ORF type:complete len:489 (+),score=82.67 Plantae.Rhodophyta-Hildenbrandia_rubra.ctg2993:2187-3653(+)